MNETRVISLNCPNCAGGLTFGPTDREFACGNCGSTLAVEHSGGTIALRLVDAIAAVRRGTDKTAAELAIPRLKKELVLAEVRRAVVGSRVAEAENNRNASVTAAQAQSSRTAQAATSTPKPSIWARPLSWRVGVGAVGVLLCISAAPEGLPLAVVVVVVTVVFEVAAQTTKWSPEAVAKRATDAATAARASAARVREVEAQRNSELALKRVELDEVDRQLSEIENRLKECRRIANS